MNHLNWNWREHSDAFTVMPFLFIFNTIFMANCCSKIVYDCATLQLKRHYSLSRAKIYYNLFQLSFSVLQFFNISFGIWKIVQLIWNKILEKGSISRTSRRQVAKNKKSKTKTITFYWNVRSRKIRNFCCLIKRTLCHLQKANRYSNVTLGRREHFLFLW